MYKPIYTFRTEKRNIKVDINPIQIKISLKGTNGDASYKILDTAFNADTKLLTNSNDGNKPINHSKILKQTLKIP